MRPSLLALLILPACSGEPTRPPADVPVTAPRVLLRTERGYESLGSPGTGTATFLAPRLARTERVLRPLFDRRGVVVALDAGTEAWPSPTASARAIVHRTEQRVVLTAQGPLVVDAPTLPAKVTGEADLPHLARQDGNLARGSFELHRSAESPATLVLLGGEQEARVSVDGEEHLLPGGPNGALVRSGCGRTVVLELEDAGCDQAYFASARAPDQIRELENVGPEEGEGGRPTFAWAPPVVEKGETWTLLIEVGGAGEAHLVQEEPTTASTTGPLTDVTREAGIDFVHLEGPDEQHDIRPTMGPGVAWGDVDGDGLVDLYMVQGGGREGSAVPSDRLYRNLGGGRFEDVTLRAGLVGESGAGMGALLCDLDGDGDLDLYLANYGDDRLYANDGQGRFEDVTEAAGIEPLGLWSAGVCAADIEGDGDLDLYVTSYLEYDPAKMPKTPGQGRYEREDPIEMLPFAFPGQRNRLLVNDGEMRFRDVTAERGLLDVAGRGMQAIFWDFDRDGDPDLYVANDVSYNVLFRNEGDGTFTDVSFATGLDDPRGGMGLAVGDVDRDGDEDLFLTNWQLEANALYESQVFAPFEAKHRRSSFHDVTIRAGLGQASMGVTSWGAVMFDLECDGDLDLYVANGYTSPDYEGTGICVGQPNHLFVATRDARFELAPSLSTAESPFEAILASRAVAGCDYDRDGDVDLVVTANNGCTRLLRNDAERVGRWLGVELRADGGNTRAIGAEVSVSTRSGPLRRSVRAGTSYLACEPAQLHFGLGVDPGDVAVEITWPWGDSSTHVPEGLDRWIVVEQPRR